MFYSETTGGFYDSAIHGDNIPGDAVEITAEEHADLLQAQSEGKRIEADADGRPVAVVPSPHVPTVAEVEALRLHAYADPLTGSDRMFAEAQRMQMMGESGWEAVRDEAIIRYNEIRDQHPWPL